MCLSGGTVPKTVHELLLSYNTCTKWLSFPLYFQGTKASNITQGVKPEVLKNLATTSKQRSNIQIKQYKKWGFRVCSILNKHWVPHHSWSQGACGLWGSGLHVCLLIWGLSNRPAALSPVSNAITSVTSPERYGDIQDLPKPHSDCVAVWICRNSVGIQSFIFFQSQKLSRNFSSINFINPILHGLPLPTKTFPTFPLATQNPNFSADKIAPT